MSSRIAVLGLGYVGLPVAVAFANRHQGTIGFDTNAKRCEALRAGTDWTGETSAEQLKSANLKITSNAGDLRLANVFIVCVPTPIHPDRRPDLGPLTLASELVGQALKPGDIVVFESTVYPGATECFCGPILEKTSGLQQSKDFKLAYSPERINPGDKKHTLETIIKVVAGEDAATTALVADLYRSIVRAGVHVAPSIKVAEAAKAIENTQRDLNIALMNELAIICDLVGIRTRDVLAAARTKWNFLDFSPGLVGGHCIGVDPYYLTSKAQELGYHPEVILAGRRLNDSMGAHVALRCLRLLADADKPLSKALVGVIGTTFKENVSDIRNSRVPDILSELKKFGVATIVTDPFASPEAMHEEYGVELEPLEKVKVVDVLILAVPHEPYLREPEKLFAKIQPGGALIDVKSALTPEAVPPGIRYWSL